MSGSWLFVTIGEVGRSEGMAIAQLGEVEFLQLAKLPTSVIWTADNSPFSKPKMQLASCCEEVLIADRALPKVFAIGLLQLAG